jgi:uncharacterized protein YcaQ
MIRQGELHTASVGGVSYVWPNDPVDLEVPRQVRFLAPFDPVVWDRARFEQLWRWAYRFEAYTPVKKRIRGYYAMPVLWMDECPGWVNVTAQGSKLDVHVGYAHKKPRDPEFRRQLDAEIARLASFLQAPRDISLASANAI